MRTLYDRCLAFGLSAAGELEEANVSAELEGEPYTSWATCSAFLATEYATMDAKTMLRRTAFDGSSGKMWVRVVAWTSLVSSAAACNAIFGLEPVEQAPVDASPFDTSAHAQDANTPDHFQGDEKDAAPPCVSKADPPIDAGCALGLDDALATFYGDLSSSKLAVTASYVYVVLSGRLVRVPRTLFQAGSGPLPQCLAPLYSFGSPASAALIELTTFDGDGVCALVKEGAQNRLGCAKGGDATLVFAPAIDTGGSDVVTAGPTHILGLGPAVYFSQPLRSAAPDAKDFEALVRWDGAGTTPKVAYRASTLGACAGLAQPFGELATDGADIFAAAGPDRGITSDNDCRGRQIRRFGGPGRAQDASVMHGLSLPNSTSSVPPAVAMALTRSDDVGTSSTVLATLSTTGALLFAGWDRKTFKDGVYTSSAFDSDVVALTLAHGLPAIVPSLAYTMLRADAGADAFTLQRRRPYTEFADLQAWQRQEARAQSNFRGSSDHSLVASDDSLFLAVRAPEACASTDSYIARTRRSVP